MRAVTTSHCQDWREFTRKISLAPPGSIELIRERGADVRIARVRAPDGTPVVIKLWNRPGWRGLLRRLTLGNPAGREWRGLQRLRQAGLDVPEPIAYLSRLGPAAAHTEALITRDLGPCDNGVDHLKALIAAGEFEAERLFNERIVTATALMIRRGFIDIDHRLPNFIVPPSGVPVRLDFELIARRPFPRLWKKEYARMLGTLIGSFVFAVQPDVMRAKAFAGRLRETLDPPDAVLAGAECLVHEMLAEQYRSIGLKVEIDTLWRP